MARMAAIENHAMLACPLGTTMNAASNGPIADPAFPPTWKSDCARPCRPPEAARAIRDDSGWKTDDPIPTNPAAMRIMGKLAATDSRRSPTSVNPMPIASEYGFG